MTQEIVNREIADNLVIVRTMKFYPVCPVCKEKKPHFVLLAQDYPVYQCRECFTAWRLAECSL